MSRDKELELLAKIHGKGLKVDHIWHLLPSVGKYPNGYRLDIRVKYPMPSSFSFARSRSGHSIIYCKWFRFRADEIFQPGSQSPKKTWYFDEEKVFHLEDSIDEIENQDPEFFKLIKESMIELEKS